MLAVLGPVASAALGRGETVPAVRATAGTGALGTLVRLFLLQRPVPYAAAAAALPVEEALAGGLLGRDGAEVRALVDVRPYGADDAPPEGWWVVSDLGTGLDGHSAPLPGDHVLGVGGASTTLAQLTVRAPVARSLDLGTGCGVQALHLSRHSGRVVATDVLPRALDLARLTAALCGVAVDLRAGSLFAPAAGERFDLVVSNPPFVVSSGRRFAYRDSGLPGDEVCRRLVAGAPAHLAEGGWCQLLANWLHRRGEDWAERVRGWVEPTGCQAWVVQREVQDPAAYVSLWLRDAGEAGGDPARYARRYGEELDSLAAQDVEGVGSGWVVLHAAGVERPAVRVEDWPHPLELPLGPHVPGELARARWLVEHPRDEDVLAARLVAPDGLVQEQVGRPGEEDPLRIVLRAGRGMRRAAEVDTVAAALVGACEGSLPVGAILDAIAVLLEEDATRLREEAVPEVRRLVADGLLEPSA